jgi:hypothetical protein
LIIHKTLRDERFTSPALKHLIDFIVRGRISLASYAVKQAFPTTAEPIAQIGAPQ